MLPDLASAELKPWAKKMFPVLCSAAAGEGETQPLSRFLFCGCGQPLLSEGQNTACLWGIFAQHRQRTDLNSNEGTDFLVKMGKISCTGATHLLGLMLPFVISLAAGWSVLVSLIYSRSRSQAIFFVAFKDFLELLCNPCRALECGNIAECCSAQVPPI